VRRLRLVERDLDRPRVLQLPRVGAHGGDAGRVAARVELAQHRIRVTAGLRAQELGDLPALVGVGAEPAGDDDADREEHDDREADDEEALHAPIVRGGRFGGGSARVRVRQAVGWKSSPLSSRKRWIEASW
jgi:hypothetical protein